MKPLPRTRSKLAQLKNMSDTVTDANTSSMMVDVVQLGAV